MSNTAFSSVLLVGNSTIKNTCTSLRLDIVHTDNVSQCTDYVVTYNVQLVSDIRPDHTVNQTIVQQLISFTCVKVYFVRMAHKSFTGTNVHVHKNAYLLDTSMPSTNCLLVKVP